MRLKIAIGLVVAMVATLLSVGPASAGVNVIVRSNGDVLINGDGGDNRVTVEFCSDGSALIVYGQVDGPAEGFELIEGGFADDLTINLKGGNDRVEIGGSPSFVGGGVDAAVLPDCEEIERDLEFGFDGNYDIPGNLKILGASGNDTAELLELAVGKDATMSMGSGDNTATLVFVRVGDDVTVRASGGRDFLALYGVWIDDRLDANLSAGNNGFFLAHGATGRTILRGHNGDDGIVFDGDIVDLGHNPIMITGGGIDEFDLGDFTWSGKFRLNSGSGADDLYLIPVRSPGAVLDLDTAAGDDLVVLIRDVLVPGDDFNGGPGFDEFRYEFLSDLGAVIKNFEQVEDD